MNIGRVYMGLLVVGFVQLFSVNTYAFPVTWEFEGEVTTVFDSENLLGGSVVVGSILTGTFTFESTTKDSSPDSPASGFYSDAITELSGSVGDITFSGPLNTNHISIFNNAFSEKYDSISIFSEAELLSELVGFSLSIRDPAGNMFTSNSLPIFPPSLGLVDEDISGFSIGTNSETLSIRGDITAIVPEPSVIILMLCGSTVLLRRRNRGSRRAPLCKRNVHAIIIFASMSILASYNFSVAADCNNNGLDDTSELSNCPQIDIVFIIDTSFSEQGSIENYCTQIDGAVFQLESTGYIVNKEILKIRVGGELCICCTDSVVNVYGTTTDCLPESLDDCVGEDRFEDWAPATAIVAGEKVWGAGPRVIIPISDEGARCGNPMDAADDLAVGNAVPLLLENNVTVFPVLGPNGGGVITSEMIGYGRKLAECGTPSGQYIIFDPANPSTMSNGIVRFLPSVCPSDFNGNGINRFLRHQGRNKLRSKQRQYS